MGSNHIEFEDFLTIERIEWAYGVACHSLEHRKQQIARVGWKAAQARDSKLLKALEIGAEKVAQLSESQTGRTRRSASTFAESVEHTEAQMWREAYRLCDEGKPIQNFEWIYGAAALLCGYVD